MEETEFNIMDIDKLFEEVSSNAASTKNTLKNATTVTSKGVVAATTSKNAAAVNTKDAAIIVSSDTAGIASLNVAASTSRDVPMSAVPATIPMNSCTSSNIAPCNIHIIYIVIYLIILT